MIRWMKSNNQKDHTGEPFYTQAVSGKAGPAVCCRHVDCCVRKKQVLQDITFHVEPGELFVLLGPSGSGKTMLLRCIAGLETQYTGDIHINGQIVSSSEQRIFKEASDRHLRMIFKENTLWPYLNVTRNVASAIQKSGKLSSQTRQKVDAALAFLDIEALGEKMPAQLTPAEKIETALARCMVTGTPLLLIDDALQSTYFEERIAVREKLRQFWAKSGVTILLATRDREDALTLATRVAVLHDGKITDVGLPGDIYKNPSYLHSAQTICGDTCNFLKGKAQLQEGLLTVQSDFGIWQYSSQMLTKDAKPAKLFDCVVGVRPETLRMCASWEETAVEVSVLPSAPSNTLTVKLKDHLLHIQRRAEWELVSGQQIFISANAMQANIFDAQTGRLIKRAVIAQTSHCDGKEEVRDTHKRK